MALSSQVLIGLPSKIARIGQGAVAGLQKSQRFATVEPKLLRVVAVLGGVVGDSQLVFAVHRDLNVEAARRFAAFGQQPRVSIQAAKARRKPSKVSPAMPPCGSKYIGVL